MDGKIVLLLDVDPQRSGAKRNRIFCELHYGLIALIDQALPKANYLLLHSRKSNGHVDKFCKAVQAQRLRVVFTVELRFLRLS